MSNGTALMPLSDIEKMAIAVAKSGLFGMKTIEQAMALMLVAQAEGKHPMAAAQEYHIIQGRPARKAESMLARFQDAGGKIKWTSYTNERVAAIFSHPQGGEVEIDWTMERAKAAGLAGKDNWRAYPRQMLRSRVITEGVRACYPSATGGLPSPEEIIDGHFGPDNAKDVTPPQGSRLDALEEIIGPNDPKTGIEQPVTDAAVSGQSTDNAEEHLAAGTDLAQTVNAKMALCQNTAALKTLYFTDTDILALKASNGSEAARLYDEHWKRCQKASAA